MNIAIAILNLDFPARVLNRNVFIACAHIQVARCIHYFQIPGSRLHVPGKLRQRQIRPMRHKPYALRYLVRANRPDEFSVDGKAPARINDFDASAAPGNSHIALNI